ncbi:MAG: site-2 protease family protein [Candidatus Thermoplasmatota archaeon]|nr:site-2 protease family protein [Candidatus Thermoplasmatota archaeon]MBU1941424.1 site-2 protease family protein [Candidatus Thermoplasmatota archaeon]
MKEQSKQYPSLQDLSPREYMYFPKGTLQGGKTGEFSRKELKDLFFAILALTFAFSLSISQNNIFFGFSHLNDLLVAIPIAFFGIISAFFIHELSHKFMAQKFGLWSEFRTYPKGLLFSVILSVFTPLVFAAPGAVMFQGESRPYEQGRIASAGPTANVVIAGITLPLYIFVLFEVDILNRIVGMICMVNSLLATFNLLPFNPLDGRKVLRWNGLAWSGLFLVAVLLTITIVPRVIFRIN